MAKWRIFYGETVDRNGQLVPLTYSNIVGAWDYVASAYDAQSTNVQLIVVEDPYVGRGIIRGRDYYYYYQDEWYGVDQVGMWQGLVDMGRAQIVGDPPNQQYQVWFNNAWQNVPDWLTLITHLVSRGYVKVGKAIPTAQYRALFEQALYDPDLPNKNGYYPEEDKPDWDVPLVSG